DAAFEMLRAWNQTMADAGWAAVSGPRDYGGRGATVLEQLVYTEETTRARAPMPLNVIGLNNIAPAIMHYGTEAQKKTLLPRMMRADDIWCQVYVRTDPEAPKHKGISCLIVDMKLPGIEVRPLVTLNGDTDFAEVF